MVKAIGDDKNLMKRVEKYDSEIVSSHSTFFSRYIEAKENINTGDGRKFYRLPEYSITLQKNIVIILIY